MTVATKQQIACPLCQATKFKVKYKPWKNVTDPKLLYGAAAGVPGTQTLVQCLECNFIYENPRFPEEAILEGYGAAVDEGHDSQFPMRVESFYRALCSVRKKIPPKGAKVLDVGTAGGAFLLAAERYGYDATGLEPSKFLVDQGNKRGMKIKQGTIDHAPFEKHSFDMICFWDVLEHVIDPVKALQNAKELLKPDGILLVNYPDIGTIPAKIAGKRFWWILSVHIIHFSKKTLRKVLHDTGFEDIHWKMYWQILQFGYLIQMLKVFFPALGKLGEKITPGFMKKWNILYYASQTTCLAKIKK